MYKYTLAHFQQKFFSKKLDKLFPNEHYIYFLGQKLGLLLLCIELVEIRTRGNYLTCIKILTSSMHKSTKPNLILIS